MIGKRLHELRLERGLTLLDVAKALGTSKQTISRYEKEIITNIIPVKPPAAVTERIIGAMLKMA